MRLETKTHECVRLKHSPVREEGVHESPRGCGPVGRRWHKGFGPGVHESTDIGSLKKHPYSGPGATAGAARSSSSCTRHCMMTRRTPIMGNGRREKPLLAGLASPSIAHRERAASARVGAFDAAARDFPGKRSPPRWKFVWRPKRKISAPGEAARFHRRPRRSPLLSKATAL